MVADPEQRSESQNSTEGDHSFRQALRAQLPGWRERGWVTEEGARALTERYRLDQLEADTGRLVSLAIFGVAALLVGGGAIAFVAANWDVMSPAWRALALFASLLLLHGAALVVWVRLGWERLGQALTLAASLTFGAALALLAQIYQIRPEWYVIFAPWAVGVLAVALATRSQLNGLLALAVSFVWFAGHLLDEGSAPLYPGLLLILGVPTAFYLGSSALISLTFGAAVLALGLEGLAGQKASYALLASGLAGSFLGLGIIRLGSLWPFRRHLFAPFGAVSELLLGATTLAATFAGALVFEEGGRELGAWPFLLGLTVLGGLAAFGRSAARPGGQVWSRKDVLTGAGLAFVLVLSVATLVLAWISVHQPGQGQSPGLAPLITGNLAAFSLALTGVYSGYTGNLRRHFWFGIGYAVVLIVARFFQYDTSLLLKSLVFLGAGLLVLAVGVAFERHLRKEGGRPGVSRA